MTDKPAIQAVCEERDALREENERLRAALEHVDRKLRAVRDDPELGVHVDLLLDTSPLRARTTNS